ncbi:MAG: hypothetical protein AAAFM81_01775 [Pseudomonadota bacterium]
MQAVKRQSGLSLYVGIGVLMSGCGGGGGEEAVALPPVPEPPPVSDITEGVFKDSNVGGLSYVSGSQSGVTTEEGRFTCETGGTITFSIGAVTLGTADCATLLSPASLIGDGTLDAPGVLNMASLMFMLDSDEDETNGLSISPGLQTMAESWPAIDFTADDFFAELTVPLSDIASVEQRMPFNWTEVPTLLRDHLERTLGCAYSGVFVGQLAGDSDGAVVIRAHREVFYSNAYDLEWIAYDPAEGQRSTIARFDVQMSPTFETSIINDPTEITGRFETSDTIRGTWTLPRENASGTFVANRLGTDRAAQRFSTSFSTNDGGFGVMALEVDGDQVTGEAFEITERVSFDVIGTISGDDLVLTATAGTETINATGEIRRRSFNADFSEVSGSLDIGGSFFGRGCPLN